MKGKIAPAMKVVLRPDQPFAFTIMMIETRPMFFAPLLALLDAVLLDTERAPVAFEVHPVFLDYGHASLLFQKPLAL